MAVGSLLALAIASFVLYVAERHHTDLHSGLFSDHHDPSWGPAHSLVGESAYAPLISLAVICGLALWARRGFPRGIVAGAIAVANIVVVAGSWLTAHLFTTTDLPMITSLATTSSFATSAVGVVVAVLDVVLPIWERRRLAASDPVFPSARIVTQSES